MKYIYKVYMKASMKQNEISKVHVSLIFYSKEFA